MLRLVFCIVGIYACFLTWGLVQERVSTTPYGPPSNPSRFKSFIFLNVIQSFIASLVAFAYLKFSGRRVGLFSTSPKLLLQYAQVAFLNCVGSPFGYASLRHIDYPTMILGKSCKLVPVMLMNVMLYRRRFPLYKYVCVGLITLGVSLFMLWQPTDKKKGAAASSLWGLFLLVMNLAIDGVTNATQDHLFHSYRSTSTTTPTVTGQHMMFWMNLLGSILMTVYLFVEPWTGELTRALEFCAAYPAVWKDLVLFGLCGALGQVFIFYTLEHYGSLVLVTVTVTRKLFTMLLSVFWFNHALTVGQWGGVALVFSGRCFLGIGLETYVKRSEKLGKAEESARSNKPSTNGGDVKANGDGAKVNGDSAKVNGGGAKANGGSAKANGGAYNGRAKKNERKKRK
ncbi:UAA transporter family-domain-containing protein [Jimgerdemannia flammicorona]|uniref:UDP-galactose transporter homolog 1 n=1 Tax=Jimgerdemannia flammicorona TaxID=994334 RepID=A0A433QC84_9FUNG|nr:UAA transporter family-domain-containing protein [Jimgerdemannia flammicorona]